MVLLNDFYKYCQSRRKLKLRFVHETEYLILSNTQINFFNLSYALNHNSISASVFNFQVFKFWLF